MADASTANRLKQARELAKSFPGLVETEIWKTSAVRERSLRGKAYALLRVFAISWQGIGRNQILNRAAALTYYSILAIGPLVAIVVMISGFVLKNADNENLATEALARAITLIAPQTSSFEDGDETTAATNGEDVELNPAVVEFIDNIVVQASTGSVGIIGSLILAWISIMLLVNVEKTFNGIWGVRRGRTMAQRVVFYWTFISLGAVLGFTAISIRVGTAVARTFDQLPFGLGDEAAAIVSALGPLISFGIVVMLLALFYRFIPNTRVNWIPSLLGACISGFAFLAINSLSFLYIGTVLRQQQLYGSLGLIFVLIIGLWFFWVVVLTGGQLTYAIQNANVLTNQRAWSNISTRAREMLTLGVLTMVARRFQDQGQPYSSGELAEKLRVPGQVLNEALSRLCDMKVLSPIESRDNDDNVTRYQPGRPLDTLSLGEFKELLDTFGSNEGTDLIDDTDPILPEYEKYLLAPSDPAQASRPLSEWLKSLPQPPAQATPGRS